MANEKPCLAPKAIQFIDEKLTNKAIVFEWGAGCSTVWFSHRVGKVFSVEHQKPWYERVRKMVGNKKHVTLLYHPT